MDKKEENQLNIVIVVLVVVFFIAMALFDYLKGRNAAEQYQTQMTEITREINADSRARADRWVEILKPQPRSYQPLQLQITHVHTSTCGHLADEPYYQRVWRERRRYGGRDR